MPAPRRDGLHRRRREDLARPLERVERVGLGSFGAACGRDEPSDLSHDAQRRERGQWGTPARRQILGLERLTNEAAGRGVLPPLQQAPARQRIAVPERLAGLVEQHRDFFGGR